MDWKLGRDATPAAVRAICEWRLLSRSRWPRSTRQGAQSHSPIRCACDGQENPSSSRMGAARGAVWNAARARVALAMAGLDIADPHWMQRAADWA